MRLSYDAVDRIERVEVGDPSLAFVGAGRSVHPERCNLAQMVEDTPVDGGFRVFLKGSSLDSDPSNLMNNVRKIGADREFRIIGEVRTTEGDGRYILFKRIS